jgi:hypothetical protein
MKKTMIFGAFALLMMASCAKDYTCKCTTTGLGVDLTEDYPMKGRKKDVTTACEALNENVAGVYSTTCTVQ